jgi:hypothetical protein
MLDQLRKLGLIVEIETGVVVLRQQFSAATQNIPLTPEQAKILVHLQQPIVRSKIHLDSRWSDGEFEEL